MEDLAPFYATGLCSANWVPVQCGQALELVGQVDVTVEVRLAFCVVALLTMIPVARAARASVCCLNARTQRPRRRASKHAPSTKTLVAVRLLPNLVARSILGENSEPQAVSDENAQPVIQDTVRLQAVLPVAMSGLPPGTH